MGSFRRTSMAKRIRFNQVVAQAASRLDGSGYVSSFSPGESIVTFSKELGSAVRADIRFVRRVKVGQQSTFHVDIIRWRTSDSTLVGDHGLNTDLAAILFEVGLGIAPLGDDFGWFTFQDDISLKTKVEAVTDLLVKFAVPLVENLSVSNENVKAVAATLAKS